MICGKVHSQAREMVKQGYERKFWYWPRCWRSAARACITKSGPAAAGRAQAPGTRRLWRPAGTKPAYGYRRVAWWLKRKEGLWVNRKRVLRVMREQGFLVPSRRLRARRKGEWGRVEVSPAQPNLAGGPDEDPGRIDGGLGVSGLGDRLLHAGDRGLGSVEPLPDG